GGHAADRVEIAADGRAIEEVARITDQSIDGLEPGPDRLCIPAAMARIATDARDLEGRQAREPLRQIEGACGRPLTGSVQADVEVEQEPRARTAPSQGARQAFGGREAVHGDRQLQALGGEPGEPVPLVGPERWVVHEDPGSARLVEDLGLTGLRDRQTAGAERELQETDLGRLVGLRMGPESDSVRIGIRLKPLEIRLET